MLMLFLHHLKRRSKNSFQTRFTLKRSDYWVIKGAGLVGREGSDEGCERTRLTLEGTAGGVCGNIKHVALTPRLHF